MPPTSSTGAASNNRIPHETSMADPVWCSALFGRLRYPPIAKDLLAILNGAFKDFVSIAKAIND